MQQIKTALHFPLWNLWNCPYSTAIKPLQTTQPFSTLLQIRTTSPVNVDEKVASVTKTHHWESGLNWKVAFSLVSLRWYWDDDGADWEKRGQGWGWKRKTFNWSRHISRRECEKLKMAHKGLAWLIVVPLLFALVDSQLTWTPIYVGYESEYIIYTYNSFVLLF